ncbi:hypothetical protein KR009_003254, partial [Drosophila setifemur]
GVGLLGGALAGAVIGHAVAKSNPAPAPAAAPAQVHHFYAPGAQVLPAPIALSVPAQPASNKMTVIETGAVDANGCYTQTIREPNPSNPKTYTETQTLICQTIQQANQPAPAIAPSPALVPVMPQPLPVIHVPAAAPPAPPASVAAPPAPAAPPAYLSPVAAPPAPPAPVAVAAAPSAAAPVPVPAPAPIAPAVRSNPIPAPGQQPQVIVLSKKTVYYPKSKKGLAPTLSVPQGLLVLVVLFYSSKAVLF